MALTEDELRVVEEYWLREELLADLEVKGLTPAEIVSHAQADIAMLAEEIRRLQGGR
jgi:hypothetical protein